MSITTAFLKAQKFVVKNAPTILAIAGTIGAAASVGFAVKGTLKAHEELDKYEKKAKGESYYKYKEAANLKEEGMSDTDICKKLNVKVVNTEEEANEYVENLLEKPEINSKEKFFIYLKSYAPTGIFLALSATCILLGNHISAKRLLQVSGALALSKKSLEDYKDKVAEMIGEKKAEDIDDAVTQEKVLNNPPTAANTIIPTMGNMPDLSLWYDDDSDRYFYSNIDYIRKAEIEAQRMLEKNGSLTRNDVYGILGIKEIPLADGCTWIWDPDDSGVRNQVILKTGAVLDDKGNPVGTLKMNDIELPSSKWFSEV